MLPTARVADDADEQAALGRDILGKVLAVLGKRPDVRKECDAAGLRFEREVQKECRDEHQELLKVTHPKSRDSRFARCMFRGEPFGDLGHAAEMGWVRPGLDRQYPHTWGHALQLAEAGDDLAAKVLRQALFGALMLVGPWPSRNREGGTHLDMWACAALAPLVGLLQASTSVPSEGAQDCRYTSPPLLYHALLHVPPTLAHRTASALAAGSAVAPPWLAAARDAPSTNLRFGALHVETVAFCYAQAPAFLESLANLGELAAAKAAGRDTDEEEQALSLIAAATCPAQLALAERAGARRPPASLAPGFASTSARTEGATRQHGWRGLLAQCAAPLVGWRGSMRNDSGGVQPCHGTADSHGAAAGWEADEQYADALSRSTGTDDLTVPETEDEEDEDGEEEGSEVEETGSSGEDEATEETLTGEEEEAEEDRSSGSQSMSTAFNALVGRAEDALAVLTRRGLLSVEWDCGGPQRYLMLSRRCEEAAELCSAEPRLLAARVKAALERQQAWLEAHFERHMELRLSSERVLVACEWALHRRSPQCPLPLREAVEALCPGLLAAHPDTWDVTAHAGRHGDQDTKWVMHLALLGLVAALGLDLQPEVLLLPFCVMAGVLFQHYLDSPLDPTATDIETDLDAWGAATRCLMYLVHVRLPYVAIRHEENLRCNGQRLSQLHDSMPYSGPAWQAYFRELLSGSLEAFLDCDESEDLCGFAFGAALYMQALVHAPKDNDGRRLVWQLMEEARALCYVRYGRAGAEPQRHRSRSCEGLEGDTEEEGTAAEAEVPQDDDDEEHDVEGAAAGTRRAACSSAAAIAAGALQGSSAMTPLPGQCSQPLQLLYTVLAAAWAWYSPGPTGGAQPALPPTTVSSAAGTPGASGAVAPAAGAACLSLDVAGAEELAAACIVLSELNYHALHQYLVFQPEPAAAAAEGAAAAPGPAPGQKLPLQPLQPQQQAASRARQPEAKAGQQATAATSLQAGEHPSLRFTSIVLATLPDSNDKEPDVGHSYRWSEIKRYEITLTATTKVAQAWRIPYEALGKKKLRAVVIYSQGVLGLLRALEVIVKVRQKLREEGRDMCAAVTDFRPQPPDRAAEEQKRPKAKAAEAGGKAAEAPMDDSKERLGQADNGLWNTVKDLCEAPLGSREEGDLLQCGIAAVTRMVGVLKEESAARREAHLEFQLLECEPGRPWALVPPLEAGGAQSGQAGGGRGGKEELRRAMFGGGR